MKERKGPAGSGRAEQNARTTIHSTVWPKRAQYPAACQDEAVSQLKAARADLRRGWYSVPIPRGKKQPRLDAWQELRLGNEDLPGYFANGENRGLILGEPSGGLIDVDLDCDEAVQLASEFLPPTKRRHGRKGKPESHRWYVSAEGKAKTRQFRDVDGSMLVELRGTGAQTVVPPSVHPSGEQLIWHENEHPTRIKYEELLASVARLAAAALLARHWPATGGRHDAALALAGALLRSGAGVDEVANFVRTVATAAGDDEAEDRVRAVYDTAEQIQAGGAATGLPRLVELLGKEVGGKLVRWLGLQGGGSTAISRGRPLPDIDEARERTRSLVTEVAEDPSAAIQGALEDPSMLSALATLARHSRGDYEGALMRMRSHARAKDIDALRGAVRAEERRLPQDTRDGVEGASDYLRTPTGLVWNRPTINGITPTPLTNFDARIVADVVLDDGVETTRTFEIEAGFGQSRKRFTVSASEFGSLNWVVEQLTELVGGFSVRGQRRSPRRGRLRAGRQQVRRGEDAPRRRPAAPRARQQLGARADAFGHLAPPSQTAARSDPLDRRGFATWALHSRSHAHP